LPSAEDLVIDDSDANGLKEKITGLLGSLNEKEKRVIELRFGIYDGIDHTYANIAQLFGVTSERIRQVEAKALRKLRHPYRSRIIRDYV
jgi:RNA polymerase primary sigma factor